MKSRVIFVLFLLVTLFVVIAQKNQTLHNTILKVINPIKQSYKQFTQKVSDRSKSYIFQKENIQKLSRENKVLKKYLLDQTLYLRQVNSLYQKLPTLEKLPYKSIALVDTISYVKLNNFNEVLLTPPKKKSLVEGKVYGLIQGNATGGTAVLKNRNLYGYLSSNTRCKFAVYVGKNRTPGIVEGAGRGSMLVKFIPKWANIKPGDHVETSGLDNIFFPNIPVGTVESVKVENSYKTAYIKSLSDSLHPEFFFLITDSTPTLASYYDQDKAFPQKEYPFKDANRTGVKKSITSIPKTLQTKESEVDLSEFEIPKEQVTIDPILLAPKAKTTPNMTTVIKKVQTAPKKKSVQKSAPKPKKVRKHRNPLDIFRDTF